MAKQTLLIVETYDEETEFRERHYVSFEKFIEMLLKRWPKLARVVESPDTEDLSPSAPTSVRVGVPPLVPDEEDMTEDDVDWEEVARFLRDVWYLCFKFDGSVTSGCRSKERNLGVGGKPTSKHTFEAGWGMACDISFITEAKRKEAEKFIALQYPEMHVYRGQDYDLRRIHLQGWKYGEKPHTRPYRP